MKKFLYVVIPAVLLSTTTYATRIFYPLADQNNVSNSNNLSNNSTNTNNLSNNSTNTNNLSNNSTNTNNLPPISQAYFRFGTEGNHPSFPFEVTGLSDIEQMHRWTEGEKKEATFTIPHEYGSNCDRV